MTTDHNLLSKPSSPLKHLSLFCSNYLELLLLGTLVLTVVKQSHPRAAGPQHAAKLIMWNNLQTQGKTNIYRRVVLVNSYLTLRARNANKSTNVVLQVS